MKNLKNSTLFLAASWTILSLLFHAAASGQSDQLETEQGIVASIAPYDPEVRQAILQASQYPQALTQIQQIQTQTVTSFQNMIAGYTQTRQTWFYTITRYPDLIHTLATLPKKQKKEDIYKLLPVQDSALKEAAWKLYKKDKKELVQLDNMNAAADGQFNSAIQSLDAPAKAAFEKLLTLPDVLTLLTNNIDLTSKLGKDYQSDPSKISNHLTALHDSLNVQNQYEMAALKKEMADSPQAAQELNQASRDYYGNNQANQQNYGNNNNYYGNPYSYWYGYPAWYANPMWYPGTFGFGSGFYFGMGGLGLYGFPSYGFSSWFFNGGNYRRYPNLYRVYGNYYNGHIAGNRYMGSINHSFMSAARGHYQPGGGPGMRTLTSPSSYRRPAGVYSNSGNNFNMHSSANAYHAHTWGSYGGRMNSVGGGGFHGGGGGGFHGGGGGGFHGGGGGGRR